MAPIIAPIVNIEPNIENCISTKSLTHQEYMNVTKTKKITVHIQNSNLSHTEIEVNHDSRLSRGRIADLKNER